MSSPRLRPNMFPLLSDPIEYHVPCSQASESSALAPKDQDCALDDIRYCNSIDGQRSGFNNSGHSLDNLAVISRCRTSATSYTATLGVKGAAVSKSHPAISGIPMRGEGNKSNEIKWKQIPECSMCGDIGLRKQLFRCGKCQHRFQHTYCSNWYPKKRSYAGICNWCDTRDEERRTKQTKETENDCAASQTKSQTAVEEVDNAKTKQRKLWKRTQKGDIRSRVRNPWKNELEMLLDAATVTGESGLESKTGNEVAKVTPGLTRPRSSPQTDQPSDDAKVDGINCKEPSSLAKKIGRRYKLVVDVY